MLSLKGLKKPLKFMRFPRAIESSRLLWFRTPWGLSKKEGVGLKWGPMKSFWLRGDKCYPVDKYMVKINKKDKRKMFMDIP